MAGFGAGWRVSVRGGDFGAGWRVSAEGRFLGVASGGWPISSGAPLANGGLFWRRVSARGRVLTGGGGFRPEDGFWQRAVFSVWPPAGVANFLGWLLRHRGDNSFRRIAPNIRRRSVRPPRGSLLPDTKKAFHTYTREKRPVRYRYSKFFDFLTGKRLFRIFERKYKLRGTIPLWCFRTKLVLRLETFTKKRKKP